MVGRLERGENDSFLLFLSCYPFVVSCIVKDGEERKYKMSNLPYTC